MKLIYQTLLLIICICLSPIIFAIGQYTQVGHVKMYSEYYPNPKAKFKGTIVFENGSGETLTEWTSNKSFFQCAKQLGNLFMYDRSGLGKSSPDFNMTVKKPMTAKLINEKLIQLLKTRHITPPYILVAHSYGGLYAGYLARKYPKLVNGLLMVDPVPNNYKWTNTFLKQYQPTMKAMQNLSSKEVYNQYHQLSNKHEQDIMSPELFYQLLGFEQSKKQVYQLPPLSNKIPVIILSSSFMEKNAPIKGDWYEKQQLWLNNNSNSKIIKVHSGHWIQLECPQLVCNQLKTLVDLVSSSS